MSALSSRSRAAIQPNDGDHAAHLLRTYCIKRCHSGLKAISNEALQWSNLQTNINYSHRLRDGSD